MEKHFAIGTDIGGSHVSCAAVDLNTGRILKETLTSREVNNQAHAGVIINVWAEALSEVISKIPEGKVRGIGFAMPGPFDYVKGICYIKGVAKYENLYGFNISDAISSKLNGPAEFLIRFINDVSAFAVGEAIVGKASAYSRSMSVTLGTGLGSAFISNRIPVVEGPEVPRFGCVYHLPYKKGIVDDYFSTRWLVGRYKELTGKSLSGVKELYGLASKDERIHDLFNELGNDLAFFLAPWLKKFDAEILVVGGKISHAWPLFSSTLINRLKNEGCSCKVELSDLKEDAALFGSAWLLDDEFWKSIQHVLPLM